MKLYELTSGVIAAVLIALGAYQYVNKTTVEEEPAVKEIPTLASQWYVFQGGDEFEPTDYELLEIEEPSDEPDCFNGLQVCAVKATPGTDPDHPNETELANIINGNSPGNFDSNEIRYEP